MRLHSRAGALMWVASVAGYSRGRRLLAHRIDGTGQSPAAHPRKCLGHGLVNGPQTIAAETMAQEGRLYLLPSLSRAPDSIPKLLPSILLCRRCLLLGPWWSGRGRLSTGLSLTRCERGCDPRGHRGAQVESPSEK